MKVLHISDLHGDPLLYALEEKIDQVDFVISTGDILPTYGREVSGWMAVGRIVPANEIQHQTNWCKKVDFKAIFKDKTVLVVDGNHDFLGFADVLLANGVNAIRVTPDGVTAFGKVFAGFAGVPYIDGEWNHEKTELELSMLVSKTFESAPDIVVTHCPPAGILDKACYGCTSLANAFTYQNEKATHHFFGHCHEGFGVEEEVGVTFINSACIPRIVEI